MSLQDKNVIKQAEYSRWFLIVVAVFMTCLFAANIISVKMVTFFNFVLPAGTIIFPMSYIFGDVLTEVYGYRKARRVIWLGFICNLLLVGVIWAAQVLPYPSFWDGQAAYEKILGFTPRLLVASFIAYLFGEFTNSIILAKLKIITKGKWLWVRTIGSTLVGEGLDSIVFILIAFYGTMPLAVTGSVILTQWLGKTFYEVIATPLTYVVVNFLKRKEGIDIYDNETNFSPFALTE
jgi:uncharacterized integral membrane protein (TIGR00697 family)